MRGGQSFNEQGVKRIQAMFKTALQEMEITPTQVTGARAIVSGNSTGLVGKHADKRKSGSSPGCWAKAGVKAKGIHPKEKHRTGEQKDEQEEPDSVGQVGEDQELDWGGKAKKVRIAHGANRQGMGAQVYGGQKNA